jgi:hypothetical protein
MKLLMEQIIWQDSNNMDCNINGIKFKTSIYLSFSLLYFLFPNSFWICNEILETFHSLKIQLFLVFGASE